MVLPILLQLTFILLVTAAGLFLFTSRHRKYWSRRGIPGPVPRLLSGNLDSMFGPHLAAFQFRDWTRQFGPVFGIQFGWRNMLVISEPAMVHELLVQKFDYFHARNIGPLFGDQDTDKWNNLFGARGARWKRLRTIATPAFSVNNLKKIIPIMDDSIKIFVDLLEKARLDGDGNPIDIHKHLVEMTFDVIARVALGQRESRQFRSNKAQMAIRIFERSNNNILEWMGWLWPWFGRRVLHKYARWTGRIRQDPMELLKGALMRELEERKKCRREQKGPEGDSVVVDFIDLFLDLETEQQICREQQCGGTFDRTARGAGFERRNTPEEMVMQLVMFLLAGFDTTANSVSVVCYNLANHPEVQQRVQEEIDGVCTEHVEDPSYEQLSQLKYTEAVIKETLRLDPIAASVVNRICAKTTSLGNITVEEGTAVQMDSMTLQRNKEVWGEDADRFRPERWLEDQKVPPNSFYAFGGGPRICIGMRMALIEERLALVRLLRKFTIGRCAETPDKLNFTGQVVHNPNAVWVALELRDATVKNMEK